MKKRVLSGLLSLAAAATLAIAPVSPVEAAGTTITVGSEDYTLSEMPVAAYEVTKVFDPYDETPYILYSVPANTTVSSRTNGVGMIGGYDLSGNANDGVWCNGGPMDYSYEKKVLNVSDFQTGGSVENGEYYIFMISMSADLDYPVDEIYLMEVGKVDITVLSEAVALCGGTITELPVADAIAKSAGQAVPQDATVTTPMPENPAVDVPASNTVVTPTPGTYIVERNDNLWKIAAKVYGDGEAWRDIYNANSNVVKNNYIIYTGQVLIIPAR